MKAVLINKESGTNGALLFDLTAQLGKRDDRNLQFLRQNLEAARNRTDGDGTVFLVARLHQLQVVDNQHIEFALALEVSGLAHEFHDAEVGVVIHEQRSLVDRPHVCHQLVHLVRVQLVVAELTLVHAGTGTQQALGQLKVFSGQPPSQEL